MLNDRYKNFAKLNIYQIYPRSFMDSNNDGNGDLNGIILKLDYLKELNINAIWISPFFTSPMIDNGYDISDYQDINPMFGTMDDFKRLIVESHKRGIKVIVDLVANHCSTEHKWFKEAIKDKNNKYHDYFYFFDEIPNEWNSVFSGSAYEYVPSLNQYYLHSFAIEQADLNWENPEVREEIKNIVDFYVNLGVDGFRCDVLDMISKDFSNPDGNHNGPRLHEFINELFGRPHLKDIFTVGECWSTTTDNLLLFVGQDRYELSSAFQGDIVNVGINQTDKFLRAPFKYEDIARNLDKWQKISLNQDFLYTLFYENHDRLRSTTQFEDDEVTNHTLSTGLATMLYLLRGVTFVYQGQEIGSKNSCYSTIDEFDDIESKNYYKDHIDSLGESEVIKRLNFNSRDNARRPICWDNSVYGGFSGNEPWIKSSTNKDTINVKKDLESQNSIFRYYSSIFKLRNEHEAFTLGEYELVDLNENHYIYKRYSENEEFLVYVSFKNDEVIEKPTYKKVILSNNNRIEFPDTFKKLETIVLQVK